MLREILDVSPTTGLCFHGITKMLDPRGGWGGGGGTLGISGWGCAAETLEPLAYTRASFSWILLPYTRVNSPESLLS